MEFEIVKGFPPNYEEIKESLGFSDKDVEERGVVFCYGVSLYNPTGLPLPPHLIVHEKIHQKQQLEIGVQEWWSRYLADKDFRLEQELEAYSGQYQFVKEVVTSRTAKDFLSALAMDMTSNLYGFVLEYGKAESLIRNYTKWEHQEAQKI